MKLLFTGPIKDFSGFAHASRDLVRSLSLHPELDVVARPLFYDKMDKGREFVTPEWMQTLLTKDLNNVDMCLQMTTCNVEANPVPGIPNGLYTFFETDRIQPAWAEKANSFDFLMVPCRFNAETLMRSGVRRPIVVAAPPCDLDVYNKEYAPLKIKGAEGRTVFYNICQLSTKKGIDVLLRAYYAAFASMPDDVLLVLKTYVNMQNRQNDLDIVKQFVHEVKVRSRIPVQKFPPVLPLVYTMTDDEIHSLHTAGDAYVCSSRAEGWGIPVFDALAHGKTVISHRSGGLGDFVNGENSLLYSGTPSLFYDMPHPDPGLFTGLEQCFEPSSAELALVMQRFHLLKRGNEAGQLDEKNQKEWDSVIARRSNGRTLAEKLDYRNTSAQLARQLLHAHKSWQEDGAVKFVVDEERSIEETI